ncbi:MAG: iron ABC transporter permease [Muribaculaceae bacterium]|nr:iron ABC transporter permease [Muribaculaceae bacterium]
MKRTGWLLSALALLTAALFAADVCLGSVDIPLRQVMQALFGNGVDVRTRTIVIDLRLVKAATALLAGIALSVSGLQMQTLFRNPLAGPYVLGLSSGASLGVALLLLAGVGSSSGIAAAAMAGAAAVMGLLLIINERVRNVMTLLILGILFSSAIGSVVQILQFLSHEQALKSYVVWTMGSLSEVTAPQLGILGGCVAAGLLLSVVTAKPLNLLELGEVFARSAGVDLRRSRLAILASTTLLAGSVTAFCGPIGFIGMAMPHIARTLTGASDHRVLLGASALVGACVLIGCDIIARRYLIPINAVTSLAGIPVVIYVVIKK